MRSNIEMCETMFVCVCMQEKSIVLHEKACTYDQKNCIATAECKLCDQFAILALSPLTFHNLGCVVTAIYWLAGSAKKLQKSCLRRLFVPLSSYLSRFKMGELDN